MDAPADATATETAAAGPELLDEPPSEEHPLEGAPPPAPPRVVPEPELEPAGDRAYWPWLGDWLTSLSTTRTARVFIDVAAVGLAMVFVFTQLHPDLIFADNTPTGGDMGAHVLGPAYLRDHLLPEGRLTGWSPDWYAGFPLYHFYMVVPALAIVAINTGWRGWAALVPLALAAAVGIWAGMVPSRRKRRWLATAAVAIAVLGVGLPYGVAFKILVVLGPIALPVACYASGRLARIPFPGPALMAGAALLFLANTEPNANDGNTGNIIGGNLTSTMAGEFSFTISLVFMVVYFGLLVKGLRTGRHRGAAAVVLALCGLCHLIPAIYAALATVVAVLVGPPTRARLKWVSLVAVVGGLLAAFWIVPFVLRRAYLNDMGWEKLPLESSDLTVRDFLVPSSLYWVVALAAVGVVLSLFWRRRAGLLLAGCAAAAAAAFVLMPEYRLWNARVLPLWYLALYLLAAIGVAELARAVAVIVAPDPARPVPVVREVVGAVGFLCALAIAGVHLGSLPGGTDTPDGGYRWWVFSVSAEDRSSARGWAEWNFSGYEGKPAYPEYYGMVTTMERIGEERGCGRSLWEYGEHLGQYGTPMAPMLLPFWSDSCIGSMEGLFFESSATTPYHFMTQSALSANGSRAQRHLPYTGFDLDLGIQQLQLLGVDYYLAFEAATVAAADAHPQLELIETSGPWHMPWWTESTRRTSGSPPPRAGTRTRASGTCCWPTTVPRSGSGSSRSGRPGPARAGRWRSGTWSSSATRSASTSASPACPCWSGSRTSPTGRSTGPRVPTGSARTSWW
jgi:hypothetical protein